MVVIFTTAQATIAAFQKSLFWARELDADIRIIVPVVVPFALELDKPPVDPEQRLQKLLEVCQEANVHSEIEVLLCRDRYVCLRAVLVPCSLVVIGSRSDWWPFSLERRLRRALAGAGHKVVLVGAR